jgi:hypothetical protein
MSDAVLSRRSVTTDYRLEPVAVELSNRRLPAHMRFGRLRSTLRLLTMRGSRSRRPVFDATAAVDHLLKR